MGTVGHVARKRDLKQTMEHKATKQKAYGKEDLSQLDDFNEIEYPAEEERSNIIEDLKKRFHEKFALVLQAKEIEHERKLIAQKSIDTATSACIQDELETERTEHAATKRELYALRIYGQKSAGDKVLMIKELDTEKARHAATREKLAMFNAIDTTRALTEHIKEMQFFINSMRHELESASIDGKIDMRTKLLLKDMHDSLLLKTTSNYQCLFLSEEACKMGMRFTTPELGVIGVPIAERVKMEQTDKPSKHRQFVDGHVTWVNTYSQKSKGVIQDELRTAWNAKRARTERS